MDRIFVEEEKDGLYRIAVIDKHRIFSAKDPGGLATVFEFSLDTPTHENDAQVFYVLAPSIGADDIFADFRETYHSQKLNNWSIVPKNRENTNLFLSVEPLTRTHRLDLYNQRHTITPNDTITSVSDSLFSLVSFADHQSWKTGILQRCIDHLVNPKYRSRIVEPDQAPLQEPTTDRSIGETAILLRLCDPKVYSVIDEEYRRIMRYKLETEKENLDDIRKDEVLHIIFIRRIISLLGLKSSHDTTPFPAIPIAVFDLLNNLITRIPSYTKKCSDREQLSDILTLWSGASVKEVENGFQLQLNSTVTEGLTYMQPWLPMPQSLVILETPM